MPGYLSMVFRFLAVKIIVSSKERALGSVSPRYLAVTLIPRPIGPESNRRRAVSPCASTLTGFGAPKASHAVAAI
jgi:hypothetical protein